MHYAIADCSFGIDFTTISILKTLPDHMRFLSNKKVLISNSDTIDNNVSVIGSIITTRYWLLRTVLPIFRRCIYVITWWMYRKKVCLTLQRDFSLKKRKTYISFVSNRLEGIGFVNSPRKPIYIVSQPTGTTRWIDLPASTWEVHSGDYMAVDKASATGDSGDHFCVVMPGCFIDRYQGKLLHRA